MSIPMPFQNRRYHKNNVFRDLNTKSTSDNKKVVYGNAKGNNL